ncbi:MAG: M14-type cytosolic carboxypeptidase [Polyangiales bacterium]
MQILSSFDGGNIEVIRARRPSEVELSIRHDTNAPEFRQWFHFKAQGVRAVDCRFSIKNAGDCTYPDAFDGYRACASYDGKYWFRVPTTFDGQSLIIEHTPKADTVSYAYFAPYGVDRRERLLKRARRAPWMEVDRIGRSVEGRPIDLVTIGEDSDDKRRIWVIARQHPGETMTEWLAEGLIERLLDEDDPLFQPLLERAVFHVVPCMNPDGGVLGNLRANAAGVNLNRAWLEPDDKAAPEVACVRDRMQQTGVDLFLDVHGDERNPYCFLAGSEGNPGYDERSRHLENVFEQSLCAHNSDFQDEYGYDRDEPGGGDLRTAGNWVGELFDCLSFTLEMPFKDSANQPDETNGWSPERSKHLGQSVIEAVYDSLEVLRGELDLPVFDGERTQEIEGGYDG